MPGTPTVLLACGGYRSGSTYAYNLLGEHVERARAGARIGYVEPGQVDVLAGPAWSFVAALGTAVAKAHHSPAIPEGGRWEALLDGRLQAVCTVRDWRDVLHSFCRVYGQAPEDVLASRRWRINLDNVRWWAATGARLVRYERLVADPAHLLRAVGPSLDLPLDDDLVAGAVGAATAGDAQTAPCDGGSSRSASFSEAHSHPRTLLHARHVASPQGGGRRAWPHEVRTEVQARLAPLLAEFGYGPHDGGPDDGGPDDDGPDDGRPDTHRTGG